MHSDIAAILEESLARLQEGTSLESCLARYPKHAQELRPLLELATAVQALPHTTARAAAVGIGEQRMLAALAHQNPARRVTWTNLARYAGQRIARIMGKESLDMKIALRFTMIALAVIVILGGGTVSAVSANALPGDALYSVKRGTENLRLLLTTAPEAREQFESKLETIRRDEVRTVIEQGRTVSVRFWGELTDLDNESWTVGGLRVLVQADTTIAGYPTAGAVIEVHALTQADGTMIAQALIVQDEKPTEPTIAPSPTTPPTVAPTATLIPSPTPTPFPSPTPTLVPSLTPTQIEQPTPTATQEGDDCDEDEDCDDDYDDDDDDWDDARRNWDKWDDWKDWKDAWKDWRNTWKDTWKDWKDDDKDQDRDQGKAQGRDKDDNEGRGKAKGHDKDDGDRDDDD